MDQLESNKSWQETFAIALQNRATQVIRQIKGFSTNNQNQVIVGDFVTRAPYLPVVYGQAPNILLFPVFPL